MREPAEFALAAEEHPRLPPGDGETVSGYGVMGLPFRSGHVLGLRRWTASTVGDEFTSIWHRDPAGHWTFYESVPCDIACTRYFGNDVDRVHTGPIDVAWEDARTLRVQTRGGEDGVDWTMRIGSTPVTRLLGAVGSVVPTAAWRARPVLSVMGVVADGRCRRQGAGRGQGALDGDDVQRAALRRQPDANLARHRQPCTRGGEDLGAIAPLAQQAQMADFFFPQRGIFAVGRVFITRPLTPAPAR